MTRFSFERLADALCPWGEGYNRTRSLVGDRGLDHCWSLCDGYGRRSLGDLRLSGLTRDWSHVRDSSDEALDRVWRYLERRGVFRSSPRGVAELEERLAWYESDEAAELFRTGHMMYPEVTVSCLRNRLARLGSGGGAQ
jgi:hypothetical protein